MSLPLVAVVGRPNVGKSTFVNRIAEANEAIVHEMRGVTRDRSYHDATWNGYTFTLIDTGGIELGSDDAFQNSISQQAFIAVDQADAIVFMVDGKTGINTDDEEVARIVRRSKTPVFLVVNKLDTPHSEEGIWEFYNLGLGNPWAISSLHGLGTGDLLDALISKLKERGAFEQADTSDNSGINVALIGRPNAGKSSLANKLINDERSIVSPVAGTTRDAIDSRIIHNNKPYTIIDTAGLRRKSKMDQDVEYYGYVRAMRAIDRADIALLVIDSTLGVTEQDQRVAGYAAERGCALIIVLNKWDVVDTPAEKEDVRARVKERLTFVQYAPVIAISALTGKNVQRIWKAIDTAYDRYSSLISTSKLNAWLEQVREFGHTRVSKKAVLRMKYITQTNTCPPTFVLFVNHVNLVNENYLRFLENRLRQTFDLTGTPVRFKVKKKG